MSKKLWQPSTIVKKNSNLFADFGYTEGYNKTSTTKKPGEKSHFFSKN